MNSELITQIFEICIIPLLAILTRYAVKYFQAKSDALTQQTDSEIVAKYTKMIADTISDCVVATNQTYVNSLKKHGKFDDAAQKQAFQDTFNAVVKVLSDDAKAYIVETTGDLDTYLIKKIEAVVNSNKIEV